MKCSCGKQMKEKELSLRGFTVKGFECACGQKAYNPIEVEMVRKMVNESVKARTVANSLVVTVPAALAKLAGIKAGDELKWRMDRKHLVLETC